ncbi:VanW family protein [uncultured Corynebacterium sp.]|mgnify:CR=1 FL=1|uniref:VanW family protein n=1 Tax=uncultured Corynebacterium sp. TaxID=159447 RepID=UPI0025D8FD2E|nr:VanW family protein [uncultured Corynebacterium sp.]
MSKAGTKAPNRGGTKGWIIGIGVLIGLFVIAGVAYAFDVAANQGKVPRATSVGGVDISSMERTAAVSKLEQELGGVETKPVTVTAGELHSEFVPSEAGIAMNFQAAVDGIEDASLNPITRLASFFQAPTEHEVSFDVDDAALNPVLARVSDDLSKPATDGALGIDNGEFKVTEPILGQKVDDGDLYTAVTANWLNPDGVEVEAEEVQPAINSAVIEAMRTSEAATALDKDIVVKGQKDVTATLDRAAISQFVSISSKDGQLVLNIDDAKAQELLSEQLANSETPSVNATLSFPGGNRQVTPSQDGNVVDWDKTMTGFDDRVRAKDDGDRTFDAAYKAEPATFTTEMAEKATFDEVVGEFTTSGFSGPSGENIRVVAQTVNGAIVGPGETFSLNGYTGPRGTAQGYVESGIIIDGHSGTAVGGGISQFATTLYNAAYFAGMEDVAHTPHSYYISRYPAGREATVYEGAIDLQFKNTSNTPVRIDTIFDGSSITVRLMGVKTVNVTSTNNGRWATTQPTEMTVTEDCSPSSGAPGFTTSDTRTITDLSGAVLSQETQTTVYDPQPIVRCS